MDDLMALAFTICLIAFAIFIVILGIEVIIHPEYLTNHYIIKQ